MGGRAISLLEVVVGLGLLALILPLALNLIPSGLLTQRRAQQIQAATALSVGWMEEARSLTHPTPGLYQRDILVGGQNYRAVREIYLVDAYLLDVVVSVHPPSGPSVRSAGRIARP